MASSDGLGSLSILNEDLLRLILRDETLKNSLHGLASISTQFLRQVLRSGVRLRLHLSGMIHIHKWIEWLPQASGLHLQLDDCGGNLSDKAIILALLLPQPNLGISALTVNLNVSDTHGRMGRTAYSSSPSTWYLFGFAGSAVNG